MRSVGAVHVGAVVATSFRKCQVGRLTSSLTAASRLVSTMTSGPRRCCSDGPEGGKGTPPRPRLARSRLGCCRPRLRGLRSGRIASGSQRLLGDEVGRGRGRSPVRPRPNREGREWLPRFIPVCRLRLLALVVPDPPRLSTMRTRGIFFVRALRSGHARITTPIRASSARQRRVREAGAHP